MWVVLDVPHSGGERAGSTWKRWGSGPIPSSSAIPPYHCSLAPGKREGRKHQRLKGFAVCPRAIFKVNCWQSLACSPDRCVFMPPWALSPASQSFCSWNTQVRMPSVHRGCIQSSAVSYPSLGSSIRAEKPRSVCLRTCARKFFLGLCFFIQTQPSPFQDSPH